MKTAILIALALTALPVAGFAQDNADAMRAVAAQLREQAVQMKGQLSAEDIADMLRSAEEIEAGIASGAYDAPPPVPHETVEDRILREHDGRLDWLARETVCAGFSWEVVDTHRLTTGDRDAEREVLCRRAYRNFRTWFYLQRDHPGPNAQATAALAAYDEAAYEAVSFYEQR